MHRPCIPSQSRRGPRADSARHAPDRLEAQPHPYPSRSPPVHARPRHQRVPRLEHRWNEHRWNWQHPLPALTNVHAAYRGYRRLARRARQRRRYRSRTQSRQRCAAPTASRRRATASATTRHTTPPRRHEQTAREVTVHPRRRRPAWPARPTRQRAAQPAD